MACFIAAHKKTAKITYKFLPRNHRFPEGLSNPTVFSPKQVFLILLLKVLRCLPDSNFNLKPVLGCWKGGDEAYKYYVVEAFYGRLYRDSWWVDFKRRVCQRKQTRSVPGTGIASTFTRHQGQPFSNKTLHPGKKIPL